MARGQHSHRTTRSRSVADISFSARLGAISPGDPLRRRTDWALAGVLDQHSPAGFDPPAWIDACTREAAHVYLPQLTAHQLTQLRELVSADASDLVVMQQVLDGWAGALAQEDLAQRIRSAAEAAFHASAADADPDDALGRLLRLVYANTQTQLQGAGIQTVQAYRAVWLNETDAAAACGGRRPTRVSPLSSWTVSHAHAIEFAGMTDPEDERLEAIILTARVPIDRIMAIPAAGLANPAERELLILERADDCYTGEPLLWDDDPF